MLLLMLIAAAQGFNPNAGELFERDPQLKAWAQRLYDANGDGWLTLYEAQPALRDFQQLADVDRDGRVSVREYRAAKAHIEARFGLAEERRAAAE